MATLESSPGGSAVDLGNVQVRNIKKNTGINLIPEILGDADQVEAIKVLASTQSFTISATFVGNQTDKNTFKNQLDTWAINGDGTTGTSSTPSAIRYVDNDGRPDDVVVLDVDYTEFSGRISVVEYTLKLGKIKT